MARRQHLTLMVLVVVAFFFSISYLYSGRGGVSARDASQLLKSVRDTAQSPLSKVPARFKPGGANRAGGDRPGSVLGLADAPASLLDGESIAPKLENATLKAELGRATWKFLHMVVAKYPEKPTPEDRKTLEIFFFSFGKLYPCGDCAKHFRALLKEIPPQTGSRNAAAGWLCAAHNRVNKRLKKDLFDCSKIGDFYDCGCADDNGKDKDKSAEDTAGKPGTQGIDSKDSSKRT